MTFQFQYLPGAAASVSVTTPGDLHSQQLAVIFVTFQVRLLPEEERITGTIGAQRRVGPMDRFLDGVLGLFGIDSRADREAQRQERLRRAATATPVTAQRPVAPIRLNKEREEGEVNMTSMSDSGGVETVMSTSGRVVDSTTTVSNEAQQPTPVESLESMAMMGMKPSSLPGLTTTGPVCRGCDAPVAPNLRFCPHCGLDL